jgi:hypothetical protein
MVLRSISLVIRLRRTPRDQAMVAQDSLDARQELIDSSMVHINLKTTNEIDESAQRAGESGQVI